MASFNSPEKVFIKSKNNTNKIINNYNISLIIYSIIAIIINLLMKNTEITISFIKTLIISLFVTIIISYTINIIRKEYSIKKIYKEDNIISIAILISLFGINTNIYILILANILTLIIKYIYKNINISSALYGILLITIYNYFTNNLIVPIEIISKDNILNYLFNIKYICPLLSIMTFIYLFHNKSIKYNLVFSYIITYTSIMLLYGIIDNFYIIYPVIKLLNNGIILLVIYTLTDYKITPTISEGNTVYGIITGIISAILTFIIPNTGMLIVFILAPLLTKYIDKISPKLKYNNKLYTGVISSSVVLIILTSIFLTLIF